MRIYVYFKNFLQDNLKIIKCLYVGTYGHRKMSRKRGILGAVLVPSLKDVGRLTNRIL